MPRPAVFNALDEAMAAEPDAAVTELITSAHDAGTDQVIQASPSSRTALPFRMPGITSGLKPASSKSFIQRSGVISG